jgi:hypothetical protein
MKRAGLALSIIICGLSWWTGLARAEEDPHLDALLAQLRDSGASDPYQAKLALLDRAKSNRQARAYIAERLPRLLESYGGGTNIKENMSWGIAALRLGLGRGSSGSFVSQGDHGIDFRRSTGGEVARQQRHGGEDRRHAHERQGIERTKPEEQR